MPIIPEVFIPKIFLPQLKALSDAIFSAEPTASFIPYPNDFLQLMRLACNVKRSDESASTPSQNMFLHALPSLA
jgi:hypothetical protein